MKKKKKNYHTDNEIIKIDYQHIFHIRHIDIGK
jgi:hypothetical protein